MPNLIFHPMHSMHSTHSLLHCITQVFAASLMHLFRLLLFKLLSLKPAAVGILVVSWQCLSQSHQICESSGRNLTELDWVLWSMTEHCKHSIGYLDLIDLMPFNLAVVIPGVAWLDGNCRNHWQLFLHVQILTHRIISYSCCVFFIWHKTGSFLLPSYFFLPFFLLFFGIQYVIDFPFFLVVDYNCVTGLIYSL